MSVTMEKIVALAKRRGFIFPGSEIYGGIGGFWDFGPAGAELKKNIKDSWWKEVVYDRDDVYGLDSTIIHNPKVWQASGHTLSFTDPLRECKSCHKRFRADQLKKNKCPECGEDLTEVKQFNLMFETYVGPAKKSANKAYLRPETAQGIFINFANIVNTTSAQIPFGIAQIGKGFRNEITLGNFIFRDREFEMMELEYFVKPHDDEKWFDYWLKKRLAWHKDLGIDGKKLRFFDHPQKSLAHYSKRTVDIEYQFPFGWGELEGIANRTDYDLKNHAKVSGQDLAYKDRETGKKYYPYVIEPSLGVERMALVLLLDGYKEEKDRVILGLHPRLSPYKVAVFPLLANQPKLVKKAHQIYEDLKQEFTAAWDARGNIGKRYYAQDEVGTPWCVTIDYQTLKDETVTVRDRDTTKQVRVPVDKLSSWLQNNLKKK